MKIKITLKDPDGVYEAVTAALTESIADVEGLSDSEREVLIEGRREVLDLGEWVESDEYVTIEIDTNAGTATVVPVS